MDELGRFEFTGSDHMCNGDCGCSNREEFSADVFTGQFNQATTEAIRRLTSIIIKGPNEDAIRACETLFTFVIDLNLLREED